MFKFVAFALTALATISMVGAVAIPRQSPPAGWDAAILEPYADYHSRYLAIGCQNQHNTQFFADCCHPLKTGETLENNRLPYCSPGANPSSSLSVSEPASSPAPQPTPISNIEDDQSDDSEYDDCEEEPTTSPTPTTPSNDSEPTPTPTPTPSPSPNDNSNDTPTPTPSPTPAQGNPTETHTGGDLTWFTQNGVAGACGTVHSDSDFIVALDTAVYGDTGVQSPYCGKTIRITWQGKSVDAVVADACPTCDNASSVDLSVATFQALSSLDAGLLQGATWELLG